MTFNYRNSMALLVVATCCRSIAAPTTGQISVTLEDGAIALSQRNVVPGLTDVLIKNDLRSRFTHDFRILRTEIDEARLPVRAGRVHAVGGEEVAVTDSLLPGEAMKVRVRLRPGHYVIVCDRTGPMRWACTQR